MVSPPTATRQFPALGTIVAGGFRLDPVTADRLFDDLQRQIAVFENRFSRFLPDSELSRLNQRAGKRVPVSRDLIKLILTAQGIWRYTDGLIDSTIGQALVAAGYDAPFELLPYRVETSDRPMAKSEHSFAEVKINRKQKTVFFPADLQFDFGGLGKGYLLDQLRSRVKAKTSNYWLSLGGDMIVSGTDTDGRAWSIGIQDPNKPERDFAYLRLPAGEWNVATSGTTKRRGGQSKKSWHHIIDPRTGQPARTDVIQTTVLAPTAVEADALAKVVLLLGPTAGLKWAARHNLEALIVTKDSRTHTTPMLKNYLAQV
ncbi:MAG: FAD:protein FMN transferase [Patescibacteria group bacterium]